MLMAALNPKAQAVVQAGRGGFRPAAGDRERLEALIDARLAAVAPSPAVRPVRPLRAGGGSFMPQLAIGVALVGGAAFLTLRPKPGAPPPVTASLGALLSSAPVQPVEPANAVEPEQAVVDSTDSKGPVEPPPVAPPHTRDRLALEVALLSRAMSDLRSGRAADALRLLDEHQRKFPQGVLGVERRGARAQALCSLKRVAEGRAELARLAPQSPAAGRAKQVCDAASGASASASDGK
jgi:hypothetical protein